MLARGRLAWASGALLGGACGALYTWRDYWPLALAAGALGVYGYVRSVGPRSQQARSDAVFYGWLMGAAAVLMLGIFR
jgi:hypothetical protein